ncbi:hypothetical protein Q7P37_009154 [Cladosporium fusiforme]
MAETAVITPTLPQGSLKSAFAKLDDELLAASQPGSPSMSATKPTSQPDMPSPLAISSSTPTSQPAAAAAAAATTTSARAPKPAEAVLTILTTPNPSEATLASITTSDVTFICPHWNIPESQKRSRRHSNVAHTGAAALAETFTLMRQHRRGLKFDVETSFASGAGGEDVAVFGRVQWESEEYARRVQMPFAVWAKVGREGRVEFMQLIAE